MVREYSHKRSSRSSSGVPHLLGIIVIFLLGYLAASFFDFDTVTHWINTQVLAYHEMKKIPSQLEAPKHAAIPPKPKFEFYTLLANEKNTGLQSNNHVAEPNAAARPNVAQQPTTIPSSESVSAVAASSQVKLNAPKIQQIAAPTKMGTPKLAAVSASSTKGNFLVQVASFKARQDAEHMKGSLILKGFSVYIIPVNHPTKGNWFRVVVGPYANRILAQQAQVTLARNERLNGMVTTGG